MPKRKFYKIEQDDGKASPTSNRVTKRAKLMNSSDSKFKNMKKTKRYIDKLTDFNAKKNVIEEEDKDSISDVEERSVIFKNKEKRATEATKKEIFENIKTEEIYTESEWSEEELKFSLFIFDLFEEVPIRGDGNYMFSSISIRRVWLWKLLSIDKRDDLRLYIYKLWKVYTFYYWWRSWQLS